MYYRVKGSDAGSRPGRGIAAKEESARPHAQNEDPARTPPAVTTDERGQRHRSKGGVPRSRGGSCLAHTHRRRTSGEILREKRTTPPELLRQSRRTSAGRSLAAKEEPASPAPTEGGPRAGSCAKRRAAPPEVLRQSRRTRAQRHRSEGGVPRSRGGVGLAHTHRRRTSGGILREKRTSPPELLRQSRRTRASRGIAAKEEFLAAEEESDSPIRTEGGPRAGSCVKRGTTPPELLRSRRRTRACTARRSKGGARFAHTHRRRTSGGILREKRTSPPELLRQSRRTRAGRARRSTHARSTRIPPETTKAGPEACPVDAPEAPGWC